MASGDCHPQKRTDDQKKNLSLQILIQPIPKYHWQQQKQGAPRNAINPAHRYGSSPSIIWR